MTYQDVHRVGARALEINAGPRKIGILVTPQQRGLFRVPPDPTETMVV